MTNEKWYARKSPPSPFENVGMWASSLANLCLPRSSYRAVHDRCSRAVSRRAPACLCRYRVLYHHEEQHGKPGLETSTGAVEWVEALQHFVPGLGRCSHADVQPVSSLWPVQNQTPRSFIFSPNKHTKGAPGTTDNVLSPRPVHTGDNAAQGPHQSPQQCPLGVARLVLTCALLITSPSPRFKGRAIATPLETGWLRRATQAATAAAAWMQLGLPPLLMVQANAMHLAA